MSKARFLPRLHLRVHLPFFRIFYSSTYTALLIATFILLCATPADHVYQILTAQRVNSAHKVGNLFVIGAAYFATALVALFIYASRLYTNRATLVAIPRSYIPVAKGEVSRNVHKMIIKNRQRSALVALESKPRDLMQEIHSPAESALNSDGVSKGPKPRDAASKTITSSNQQARHSKEVLIHISPTAPPWGDIMHAGWSSPCNPEIPLLEFSSIVAELPNLLEAKVVGLAPPDPAFNFMPAEFSAAMAPPPDPAAVAYLQRTPAIGLREYISRLKDAGLFATLSHSQGPHAQKEVLQDFVEQYERARFAHQPLTEGQFSQLIGSFSVVLAAAGEGIDSTTLTENINRVVGQRKSRTPMASRSSSASESSMQSRVGASRNRQGITTSNPAMAALVGHANHTSTTERRSEDSSERGSILHHRLTG